MYREQLTHAVAPRPRKKWIHPHLLFFSKSNYPAIPQTILLQPPLSPHTRKYANTQTTQNRTRRPVRASATALSASSTAAARSSRCSTSTCVRHTRESGPFLAFVFVVFVASCGCGTGARRRHHERKGASKSAAAGTTLSPFCMPICVCRSALYNTRPAISSSTMTQHKHAHT